MFHHYNLAGWKLLSILSRFNVGELASKIDHAVLKPWSSLRDLEKAVEEVESLNLRCLVTTPTLAKMARELSDKCVSSVVGFPFGYHTVESKIKELEDVIGYGVDEVDFVSNYQLIFFNRIDEYINEVKAIAEICRETGTICKVIIEIGALDYEMAEKVVTRIGEEAEPHFIKTSTGYGPRATFPEDVILIDKTLRKIGKRDKIGIKAAGGVRTALQAITLISLGADIIGTSTPKNIVDGFRKLCKDIG